MSVHSSQVQCTYFVDSAQGGRQYMEDFLCTTETENTTLLGKSVYNHKVFANCDATFFGVFDGHGGPEAAKFAQCNLLSEITKQPGFHTSNELAVRRSLEAGFSSTSLKMWNDIGSWPKTASGRPSTAGTTASVVMIRGQKMYLAHVGDSTVILGVNGVSQQPLSASDITCNCIANVLTTDHKPSSPAEKQRIEKSGGSVMEKSGVCRVVWYRQKLPRQGRVLRSTSFDCVPFLAVSRALGDLWSYSSETGEYSVSSKPDVAVVELDVARHKFVILATDGLWNVVRPSEATAVVSRYVNKLNKMRQKNFTDCDESVINKKSPATALIRLALQRWSHHHVAADNISVIVVLFEDATENADSLSPSVSESSSLDSGIECSTTVSIHRYPSKRKLFNNDMCPSKRRLLTSNVHSKKRKVDGSFQIPATSDQWNTFWSRKGSVGEVMIKSVLQGLDSNQLAEKEKGSVHLNMVDQIMKPNSAV